MFLLWFEDSLFLVMRIFSVCEFVNCHVPDVPNVPYAHDMDIPNYGRIQNFESFQNLRLTNIVFKPSINWKWCNIKHALFLNVYCANTRTNGHIMQLGIKGFGVQCMTYKWQFYVSSPSLGIIPFHTIIFNTLFYIMDTKRNIAVCPICNLSWNLTKPFDLFWQATLYFPFECHGKLKKSKSKIKRWVKIYIDNACCISHVATRKHRMGHLYS